MKLLGGRKVRYEKQERYKIAWKASRIMLSCVMLRRWPWNNSRDRKTR
jgi:hypothetical protein